MELPGIVRNKKGSTGDTVMTAVLSIIVVAVLLMVVVPVLNSVNTSLGTIPSYNSTGGTGNTIIYGQLALAQQGAINNTGAALNIASIIPMVLAASAIITALLVGLYAVFFKKK
jgi:hypothetical protein